MYQDMFGSWEDVQREYEMREPEPDEVIAALYKCESYEGSSVVVYRQGNTYYHVYGSHCSCYGLEGQWNPDEIGDKATTIAYYEKMLKEGWGVQQDIAPQVLDVLMRKKDDAPVETLDLDKVAALMVEIAQAGREYKEYRDKLEVLRGEAETCRDQMEALRKRHSALQANLMTLTGAIASIDG